MKNLDADFLNEVDYLSAEEIAVLAHEIEFKQVKKDDFLLQKGQICAELSFLIQGTIVSYDINEDDVSKNIIGLNTKGEWILNTESFVSRQPSKYFTQAYSDCILYEFSLDSLHRLIANSQNFLRMGKLLAFSGGRIDFYDNKFTPDSKYEYILENRPQLLQDFPLTMIASYLKVAPETLSRVRKRISTK